MYKPIIVIPFYNHFERFLSFYTSVERKGIPIVIINDGSDYGQGRKISELCKSRGFFYIENAENRGKGYSVISALNWAFDNGFSHALQIDADGQHCADDIDVFIKKSQENSDAIICGNPVYDDSAPKARLKGRGVTKFWVRLETGGVDIGDSLCGFRIYPLQRVKPLLNSLKFMRMGFDTESIVKFVWDGIEVINVPTKVIYPKDGLSHFRMIYDNLSLISLHTYLCCLSLVNLIGKVIRKCRIF